MYVSTGDYSPIIVTVSPDDDLYFTADFDKMNAPIPFNGRGSVKNNFIERRKLKMTDGIARDFMVRSWYKEDAEKLRTGVQSIYNRERECLNEHREGLSTDFISYWSAQIEYQFWNALLDYPTEHALANNGDTSSRLWDIVRSIPLNFDDKKLCSDQYREFVRKV